MQAKKKLIKIINEIIDLMVLCNEEKIADNFRARIDRWKNLNDSPGVFKSELLSLQKSLFGMGSFTDHVIYPDEESKMNKKYAESRQVELAQQLDETIEKLLEKMKGKKHRDIR